MTTSTKSSITTLFMVAVMLLAATGAAAAASPTVDSEATETSTSSALTDGSNQTTFNASDAVNLSTLQADYDSDNPGVWIKDPDTGDIVNKVTNETHPDRWTETNATADYYNVTLSESHFAAVPMDAGQNKSVTLVLVNNTSHANPAFTNITVHLENTDERSVVFAGASSDESGGIADVEERETGFIFTESFNVSTVEQDNVGIANDTTDVFVVYKDDEVSSPYADEAENRTRFLGFQTVDIESGDRIQDHLATVESTHYAVYDSEAPDAVTEVDAATYGEWTTVSGYDAHHIELGDTYQDETSVDIETTSNADLPPWTNVKTYGGGLFGFLSVGPGGSGQLAAGGA